MIKKQEENALLIQESYLTGIRGEIYVRGSWRNKIAPIIDLAQNNHMELVYTCS